MIEILKGEFYFFDNDITARKFENITPITTAKNLEKVLELIKSYECVKEYKLSIFNKTLNKQVEIYDLINGFKDIAKLEKEKLELENNLDLTLREYKSEISRIDLEISKIKVKLNTLEHEVLSYSLFFKGKLENRSCFNTWQKDLKNVDLTVYIEIK